MLRLRHISLCSMYLLITSCVTVSTNDLFEASVVENDRVLAAPWLYPALPIIAPESTNEKCRSDSQSVLDNIRNATTWAMQMVDASAQGVDGLLMGHVNQLGNFEECLLAPTPVPRQYCLVEVALKHPASLKYNPNANVYNAYGSAWDKISNEEDKRNIRRNLIYHALCVPASCTHQDLQASIDRHLAESPRNTSISVNVSAALCQKSTNGEVFSNGTRIYCAVMMLIVLAVVMSTIYDVRTSDDVPTKNVDQQRNAYLLSFSLKKNISNMKKVPKESINCVSGLKFIALCFIIIGHRAFLNVMGPNNNFEAFEHAYTAWYAGIVLQADVLVDSFFMISGILVTYIMMIKMNELSINPFMGILLRYIRLTPAYAVVVFFFATLLYHMGEGPNWPAIVGPEREYCLENWWTNLLYINNYVNDEHLCVLHSWYIPCDMHYFVFAMFLLPLIHKFPLTGYFVLGVTTIASIIVQVVISYIKHQQPLQFFHQDLMLSIRTNEFFSIMYSKTHIHATPYLVGMLIGLILFRTKPHHHKYNWLATLVQLAGVLVCAATLVPGCFMITGTMEYGPLVSALEQPQRRFFWPLGLGLFTIGLALSKRSIIDRCLSSRPMVFLSKLVYSGYLVSFSIQLITAASVKTSPNPSHFNLVMSGISDIVLSLFFAFVLYVMVEAPAGNIMNEFFMKERKETSPKPDNP